jgi:hypothetical protein
MSLVLKLSVSSAAILKRGQDHYWRVIREIGANGRTFSASDVLDLSNEPQRGTLNDFLRRLEKAGYIEAAGLQETNGPKATPAKLWRLLKSPARRPSLDREGRATRARASQQQMWNFMRGPMARSGFTCRDLAAYASTDEVPVPLQTAKSFVKTLNGAGYLTAADRGRNGSRWRLKPSMNTGPLPPMILRAKLVFDQNRHSVMGETLAEEVQP